MPREAMGNARGLRAFFVSSTRWVKNAVDRAGGPAYSAGAAGVTGGKMVARISIREMRRAGNATPGRCRTSKFETGCMHLLNRTHHLDLLTEKIEFPCKAVRFPGGIQQQHQSSNWKKI